MSSFAPSQPITSSEEMFTLADADVRSLLRDLHKPKRGVFWADLLCSAVIGWAAFAASVVFKPFSPAMLASVVIAVAALYRSLCFMHEITHQNARALPHFETAWNWLVGFPLLMPSFVYVGVHQNHHRISSYGTAQDPEYLPFAHSRRMTVVFALESFFIPLALVFRFIVLTPFGLLSSRFQKLLVVYGSALTMNVKYRREATTTLIRKVRQDSTITFAIWASVIALAAAGVIPWRTFAIWLAVDSLVSFVNTLRTLGAHGYESQGEQLDRMGQLLDSIDTPGAFYTEFWAPVGLRYHALHHYFPGIPYHNLAEAYRRIMSHLALQIDYSRMTSPSLQRSLRELCRKGAGK